MLHTVVFIILLLAVQRLREFILRALRIPISIHSIADICKLVWDKVVDQPTDRLMMPSLRLEPLQHYSKLYAVYDTWARVLRVFRCKGQYLCTDSWGHCHSNCRGESYSFKMPHKGRSWQRCKTCLNMQTVSDKEGKQHTAWQMMAMSCGLQTIVVRASRLCGTVVLLQQNVMTQQHLDYLAGFRGKTQASLWLSAHRFVLICFCDGCKSVEMLSQPQW